MAMSPLKIGMAMSPLKSGVRLPTYKPQRSSPYNTASLVGGPKGHWMKTSLNIGSNIIYGPSYKHLKGTLLGTFPKRQFYGTEGGYEECEQ